jgi:cyclopropane-fatty-acyl-phospholipid synthase
MWLLSRLLRPVIKRGQLTLIDASGKSHEFGVADPAMPTVIARFTDAGAPNAIARRPRLGFGEAWIDGRIVLEKGDIADLLTLFRRNALWEDGGAATLRPKGLLRRAGATLLGKLDRLNWERKSKRNVAHHYDLSNIAVPIFPIPAIALNRHRRKSLRILPPSSI